MPQFELCFTEGYIRVKEQAKRCTVQELKKVLTFRIANFPGDIRKASETFRISIGLSSFFKTLRVALLPRYPCFCNSAQCTHMGGRYGCQGRHFIPHVRQKATAKDHGRGPLLCQPVEVRVISRTRQKKSRGGKHRLNPELSSQVNSTNILFISSLLRDLLFLQRILVEYGDSS